MICASRGTDDELADSDTAVRTGIPSVDWSRDELTKRAVMENETITDRQRDASHYWLLGKALLPIRADLADGPWTRWRQENEIERTRADRAMLLASAFDSPEQFANLSIDDASALARQISGIEPRQTPLEAKHRRRLRTMSDTLQASLDDLSGPDAAQVRVRDELLLAVDSAARLLRELRHAYVAAQRKRA